MESIDEQVHLPPPTCPYCRSVLRREPDVSPLWAETQSSESFTCPKGCGSFTSFELEERSHALHAER
jgi:hypothetical protein